LKSNRQLQRKLAISSKSVSFDRRCGTKHVKGKDPNWEKSSRVQIDLNMVWREPNPGYEWITLSLSAQKYGATTEHWEEGFVIWKSLKI
jgi:hypothetical protein